MDKQRHTQRTLTGLAAALLLGVTLTACDRDPSDNLSEAPANPPSVGTIDSANPGVAANENKSLEQQTTELKVEAEQMMADAKITAAVREEIVKDPDLSNLGVSVDTKAGVVTLEGNLKTENERSKIVQIARAQPGVTDVQNRLVVDPQG
ncbi:BON domain-containing protein [Uliginosibacterium sp. H1]|uniref:BON domain-containing protein n=1 Tax=Uliginosibacterium sp. H1 TaxID=3114757 RepID=UPI002E16D680|nr:BON domain-containing protein [Uliginosibacterium sp. H1]